MALHMLQGVLLSFADKELESDYRAECAGETYRADCGLYMLALSLWVIIWQNLYFAGDWRHVWSAANALMCLSTLLGMRCAIYRAAHSLHVPSCSCLKVAPLCNWNLKSVVSWCCQACIVHTAFVRGDCG